MNASKRNDVMNKGVIKLAFWLILCAGLDSGCSKMNDIHNKYYQNGETLYVGKPDSVKVFGGNGRVLVRYWSSDPKAKILGVFWSDYSSSFLMDMPEHSKADSMDVLIDNLPEYNYNFTIHTYNSQQKNRSVALNVPGNVYGNKYLSTLMDRAIRSVVMDEGRVEIEWFGAVARSIGCMLTYKLPDGTIKKLFVSIADQFTVIQDDVAELSYQTLFLPETYAIDTFYTAPKFVNVPKL